LSSAGKEIARFLLAGASDSYVPYVHYVLCVFYVRCVGWKPRLNDDSLYRNLLILNEDCSSYLKM